MDLRGTWQALFEKAPRRNEAATTMSGVPVEPVYGPDDAEYPGLWPYTRGPYASMYRSRLWTMRQFAGFGTAEDTNERFRQLLDAGGSGLSTAFDMPTLLGCDSDHPLALGEVGRARRRDRHARRHGGPLRRHRPGVGLHLDDHQLRGVRRCWRCTSPSATRPGSRRDRLGGTIQNDILKEYQAQKEFVFPPRPSMRLVTDVIASPTAELPRWHPVSISGYHIREAGSTAAQELAFTLANGFAYVESGLPGAGSSSTISRRA